MTEQEFHDVVSQAFPDIARSVAHAEPHTILPVPLGGALKTFQIDVDGDYTLHLSLCLPTSVLQELAVGMRRGADTDEDTATAYVTEFFNILCGKIVSTLNQRSHVSSRFGIPQVVDGVPPPSASSTDYYYQFQTGPALLQTAHQRK